MLDFYQIGRKRRQVSAGRPGPDTEYEEVVYPLWNVNRREDLMTRGGVFYAVWNPQTNLWSTDISLVIELVDQALYAEAEKLEANGQNVSRVLTLADFSSNSWLNFRKYINSLPDWYQPLDKRIIFANEKVEKLDYATRQLGYPLTPGPTPAFDKLFGVLYDPENLQKIKWAFGTVLTGDSTHIQKFYALYGKPGTGKSTVLNLLAKLVDGYHAPISVSDLGKFNADFALESLKNNPLVAIDHEGDLSHLERNTMLNTVVSHDEVTMNVKFHSKYTIRLGTTIFVATNKPIKITDVKSGLTRRLIDIQPTGITIPPREYDKLVAKLDFELGAIAASCIDTYQQLGAIFYDDYRSMDMLAKTNHLFDFVQENAFVFERQNYVKRSEVWKMYQMYCENSGIQYPYPRYIFKDLFADYWHELKSSMRINGKVQREVFYGFKKDVFRKEYAESIEQDEDDWLKLGENTSIFDRVFAQQPAQLVTSVGGLPRKWDNNITTLGDIDTTKLHMVRPTPNLVMIDFDLKDKLGNKSLKLNLEAAQTWPPTYAETSKSGKGLHLYYYYDGDITQLDRLFALDIEIKPPVGKFSIRRQLTLCNTQEIPTINSGLPLKPDKGEQMISRKLVASEAAMRTLVLRNLTKEYHPHTKPSIDFIFAILQEGYDQGLEYDLSDLKDAVTEMASKSTNNKDYCLAIVSRMKFKSDENQIQYVEEDAPTTDIVFFDMEVFPNVLIISWKLEGDHPTVTWYNPPATRAAELLDYKLIGFNNRMYDNHILYGWILGDSNEDAYLRSKSIVENKSDGYFSKAFGLSYTDVHSYSSVKQSLKKWEIELGIPYDELDWPWDKPLPEDMWERAGQYCANDVSATEAVHHHRHADFQARKILAALSGLRINDSTRAHVQKIIFGDDKEPQDKFNIPDLSEEFPGYTYDQYAQGNEKSKYRGEFVGEGGYVWAEPGIYENVAYLDIASMHPTSLVVMNLFGPYTNNFAQLKDARVAIKEGRLDDAAKMFDGKLAPYLDNPEEADDLAYALKIALNSVYGYTSTQKYDWAFRDDRNVDNVVAKRGALFMVDLKNAMLERGIKPVHFKTDSVKIANCTDADIQFVKEFGAKYGYDFGIEGIFERMVLINDAVLIGKWKDSGEWYAVGARFAHPYVYKTLFTREKIEFSDLVETRMVSNGATIYLDSPDGRSFIGRVGQFCPVKSGGGKLLRIKDDKESALPGTKDYEWLPANVVEGLDLEEIIDLSYFDALVEDSLAEIAKFGDPETFLEGE